MRVFKILPEVLPRLQRTNTEVFMKSRFLAGKLLFIFMLTSLILGEGTPILRAQDKPGWEAKWERTVAAARKEGQLNVYITLGPHRLVEDFQKVYPTIKTVGVFGRSSDLVARIHAERRAGKYLADARIGGGGRNMLKSIPFSQPVKPILMLPEVLDESKWWHDRHSYADPEKRYFFVFIGEPQLGSVYYNTKLVDPMEFKSSWDLLAPKWKGKITIRDPRGGGPGGGAMRFYYHNPPLGLIHNLRQHENRFHGIGDRDEPVKVSSATTYPRIRKVLPSPSLGHHALHETR